MRIRSTIPSLVEGEPDGLFIACVSFERRCRFAAQNLSRAYRCGNAVLIRFNVPDPHRLRQENRHILHDVLSQRLLPGGRIHEEWCDKSDPVSAMAGIASKFDEIGHVDSITIDISTFTKLYLLIVLREVQATYPHALVRLLYTPAYHRGTPKALTSGGEGVIPIPYYGGVSLPDTPQLLVLFLGYEGERAARVWRTVEPDKTIAILTDPPLYYGAEIPAWRNNQRLLESSNAHTHVVSASEPDETQSLLKKLMSEHRHYNVSVSALGPKPQMIGLYNYLASSGDERVRILYSPVGGYDEKSYTIGHAPYSLEYLLRPASTTAGAGLVNI